MSVGRSGSPLIGPRPVEPRGQGIIGLLCGTVDGCLAGAVLLVPACVGGRIAAGQLVLVVLAFSAGVAWCLRQAAQGKAAWQWSGAEIVLACAVAVPCLQLAELPAAVAHRLSGVAARVAFLEEGSPSPEAGAGPWRRLSLDPGSTRQALVMVAALAVFMLAATQRMATPGDVERMLRVVAWAVLVASLAAVAQYLAGSDKFLGVFAHPFASPSRGIQGTFSNRNHFAHFVALGLGPLGACALWAAGNVGPIRAGTRPASGKTVAWGGGEPFRLLGAAAWLAGLVLAIVVGLAPLSRGGMLAMAAAGAAGPAVLLRHAPLRSRVGIFATAGAMLLLACLAGWKSEALARRLDTFQSLETLDQHAGRRRLWRANLAAWAEAPWLGTGVGSHAVVCPMYLDVDLLNRGVEYTHAENGYCQVLSEAGLVGLGLLLAAIGIVAVRCVAAARHAASDRMLVAVAAVVAGLVANLVHAAVDFVWYVPGCMVAVAMLVACALRLGQWARPCGRARALVMPRAGWLALALALAAGGALAAADRFRAAAAEACWFRTIALRRTADASSGAARRKILAQIAAELENAVAWQPDWASGHARLATVLLEWFDTGEQPGFRGLGVHDVCQAALASRLASREETRAWLVRALGDRLEILERAWRHARRAVQLCPLRADAYLALADLCFLESPGGPAPETYLAQAARIRPHDATVLLALGQQAAERGRFAEAAEIWKTAFHAGPAAQRWVIDRLADQLPGPVFLELFEPDAPALERLVQRYRTLGRTEDLCLAAYRWAELLERTAWRQCTGRAGLAWLAAAQAWDEAGQPEDALRCLRQAVSADPGCYEARLALGQRLHQSGDFQGAEEHLRWCALRRPHDQGARALLEKNVLHRLRAPLTAERGSPWPTPQ